MGDASANNRQLDNTETLKGLPQPLGWIGNFIHRYFSSMPKLIQITVFLAFVIYFMFATLRLLWPMLFPHEYIEIHGEVTGPNCLPLPDSLSIIEFVGEGLFVYKKPVGIGDQFTYEWILRVPRSRQDEKRWLALTTYDPQLKRPVILSSALFSIKELKDHREGGKTHLEIDNSFTFITLGSCKNSPREISSSVYDLFLSQAFALPQERQHLLSADTVNLLLKQYAKVQNPVAQMKIIQSLATADTVTILSMANRLKSAVIQNQREDVAYYAPLLANSRLISMFLMDDRHSDLFDSLFYTKAVQFMLTDDNYSNRSIANLLQKLQDPRSLNPIFHSYLQTDDLRVKQLFLYIIDGFTSSKNTDLINRIKRELESWLAKQQDKDRLSRLNDTINRTLRKIK